MHLNESNRSGSPGTGPSGSTVFASFLHFDLCFTIWVLLGALGVYISKDLHLTAAQKGLMVAMPTLSASVMRVVVGFLSDRISGKLVGTTMLIFLFLPLSLGWLLPSSFAEIIAIGVGLGVAGASFAVALPLASRWYPPERQGLVMGIAAAGNIGTVISNLFAPTLAKHYGWHSVLALTMLPLALVLVAFAVLARESPSRTKGVPVGAYLSVLRRGDLWWFCLFYSVTFGGFVGLGTFLPIFYNSQYHLDAIHAGYLTSLAAFMGSTLRPLGGYLADKLGGVPVLSVLFVAIIALYALASFLPPLGTMAVVLVIGVACLGMGNGAIFQLVPQRFQSEIGIATGLVGAFGGLGGFFLPTLLGVVKQSSGSFSSGWMLLAALVCVALLTLRLLVALHRGWRFSRMVTEPAVSLASEVALD
jgi:MFS transporter, NNP family, nitrate/nitrite transporter